MLFFKFETSYIIVGWLSWIGNLILLEIISISHIQNLL